MAYFSKLGHTLSFKNNLVKEIFEILKANERMIIDDNERKEFEEAIMQQIFFAHKKNPRCSRIDCGFEDSYEKNGDRYFSGYYGMNFYLYKSK